LVFDDEEVVEVSRSGFILEDGELVESERTLIAHLGCAGEDGSVRMS